MNPPSEVVPCIKCSAPSQYHNVEGGFCYKCWPQSITMTKKYVQR